MPTPAAGPAAHGWRAEVLGRGDVEALVLRDLHLEGRARFETPRDLHSACRSVGEIERCFSVNCGCSYYRAVQMLRTSPQDPFHGSGRLPHPGAPSPSLPGEDVRHLHGHGQVLPVVRGTHDLRGECAEFRIE